MIVSIMRIMAICVVVLVCVAVFGLTVGYRMVNKEVMVPGPTIHVVSCIGAFDEGNPAYIYKMDTTNLVLGIVFVETVILPVVIGNNYLRCPIGIK